MKKIIALSFGILSLNSFSQNDVQVFTMNNISDNNIGLQQQRSRAVQTYASNVQVKRTVASNVNKVNVINTVKVNPVTSNKPAVRRRRAPVQRNSNAPIQAQQPLAQINFINTPVQMNPVNQMVMNSELDNLGNSFGNEQIQVQQAIHNDDQQGGHAGDFLEGISINLPKVNFERKISTKSSSSLSSSYKIQHLKNKFFKMNRKLKGKLSLKKRLRIKVDNCFKW